MSRRVVLTRCPIGSASEIALQKGWLKEAFAELDAELVMLQSLETSEHIKHFTQESPLSFREGGNIPPIWAQSNGNRTKLLGLTMINQTHALLVRRDSDIQSPEALRSLRFSVPKFDVPRVDFWRAMVLRGYDTVLKYYGIDDSEVTFVDIPVANKKKPARELQKDATIFSFRKEEYTVPQHEEELIALAEGKIDVFLAHGALAHEIEDKGLARILVDISKTDMNKTNNIYPSIITVNEEFAEKNRDIVIRYLAETIRAANWAVSHKEEVTEISAKGQYGTTVDQVLRARDMDYHHYFMPAFPLEGIRTLKSQKDFLLDRGFITRDIDVDAWLAPEYLEEAMHLYIQLYQSNISQVNRPYSKIPLYLQHF